MILIVLIKLIYNIWHNKINKFADSIYSSFYSINYYPTKYHLLHEFIFHLRIKLMLRNLMLKKIYNWFSGLNSPNLDLLKICINSGDI